MIAAARTSGFAGTAATVVADGHVPLELDDADTDATWTLGVCATGAISETPEEEHGAPGGAASAGSDPGAGAGESRGAARAGSDPGAGVVADPGAGAVAGAAVVAGASGALSPQAIQDARQLGSSLRSSAYCDSSTRFARLAEVDLGAFSKNNMVSKAQSPSVTDRTGNIPRVLTSAVTWAMQASPSLEQSTPLQGGCVGVWRVCVPRSMRGK